MPADTAAETKPLDMASDGYEVIHSKSPVFYSVYERKSDLKHQTHYCPGCGHGVVHKLIAEAVEELGLQDRTILVTPVGCSVFGYYYFDVGNVQVAHGRAPAAATGVKRARPESIVIAYQGDGDLAAIGTAEILHAANRGEKITVFFVNNAIYGMTGGQMAPTSLIGQKTTTSPWGRRPTNEGFPLHVCELLASLEAPVYLERVALADNKHIMKARRAIRKAIDNQKNGAGFSLVEILSPCPTIWGLDPVVAQKWVSEKMIPVFPLNVFRDRQLEPVPEPAVPHLAVAKALEIADNDSASHPFGAGASPVPGQAAQAAAEHGQASPERSEQVAGAMEHAHAFRNMRIKVAGFGGQGVLLLGQLLTEMGMREGLEVSWLPSYGPEMRSGSAHCHVCLSKERIGSPLISHPDVLIAMNEISLRKFAHEVPREGLILYNRDRLPEEFDLPEARAVPIPASEIADGLGSAKTANVVLIGALLEETECLAFETAEGVIRDKVRKVALLETNRKALAAGRRFIDEEVWSGAESQPDGFAY